MPTVKWLPEALADLERLHLFLKDKNSDAAARAIIAIMEGTKLLKGSSQIGSLMDDDSGRRELFVRFASGAYVLRYVQEDKETVVIVRVWHSRENRFEE